MNRMLGVLLAMLVLPGALWAQPLAWNAFFEEYCRTGSNTCVPTSVEYYQREMTVQETVQEISARRANRIPVLKLATLASIAAHEAFFDLVAKLDPAELSRGQIDFKGKPDALLTKFAQLRALCGAMGNAMERRACYEEGMRLLVPGGGR